MAGMDTTHKGTGPDVPPAADPVEALAATDPAEAPDLADGLADRLAGELADLDASEPAGERH